MTQGKRSIIWAIGLAALLLALYALSEVLLPFVAGMALAYLLDPVVDRSEKMGLSRTAGTVFVLILATVLAIGAFLLLVPVVHAQLLLLIEVLPSYIARLEAFARPLMEHVRDQAGENGLEGASGMIGQAVAWAGKVLGRLISGGAALANLASLLFITPIVAFYLLRDWDRMVETIDGWLPLAQAESIREQVGKIDRTLAAFVRGQGMVCLILGIFYGVSLSLSGLQFGLVIGIFSGLISFVPFVGALMGGILSIGLAFLQFDAWTSVAVVAGIYAVGQILEGNVLTPNLVGGAVDLHPVWIIFALLAGGAMFGFVGVLIAVPVAAVAGVLARFGLERYLESPLHRHGIPPSDDVDERGAGPNSPSGK